MRQTIQNKWTNDRLHVICATIAFGMGINKPDVRFVIHYSFSKSIENYYQESGRAGRDGARGDCIIFYAYKDKRTVEFLMRKSADDNRRQDPGVLKAQLEKLYQMVSYCENKVDCRRVLQLRYFGEVFDRKDCKGACDNCVNTRKSYERDVTKAAMVLVGIVRSLKINGQPTKQGTIISVFRGAKNKLVKENNLNTIEGYGYGKTVDAFQVNDTTRLLLELIMREVFTERSVMSNNSSIFKNYITTLDEGPQAGRLMRSELTLKMSFVKSKSTAIKARANSKRKRAVETISDDDEAGSYDSLPRVKHNPLLGPELSVQLCTRLTATRQTLLDRFADLRAYNIATEQQIHGIVLSLPQTTNQLQQVDGFGKVKAEKYGPRFLETVSAFLQENSIAPPSRPPDSSTVNNGSAQFSSSSRGQVGNGISPEMQYKKSRHFQ
jgi:bloom syndrome protein